MQSIGNMHRCLGCMALYEAFDDICPYCGYINGSPPTEMFHLKPGTLLQNQYLLGKVLGFGGFGITYIAWDKTLKRKIAIKEYLPRECGTRMQGTEKITIFPGKKKIQFEKGLRSFLDEAGILMRFRDLKGIIRIYDRFEANNTAYIVMEYLSGETLADRLSRIGTMDLEEIYEIISPVMEDLSTLHKAGVIHRDISPDNLFITDTGKVRLLDFGTAKYLSLTDESNRSIIVKPGYAPPEQYLKNGDQGPWTDVYALAVVIYRMLTGILPEDSPGRMIEDHLQAPSKLKKKITRKQEKALMKALALQVSDRTCDMDTFKEELFGEDKENSDLEPPAGSTGFLRNLVSLILIAGLCMGVVISVYFWRYYPGPSDKTAKETGDFPKAREPEPVKNYKNSFLEDARKAAETEDVELVVIDTRNSYNNNPLTDDSRGLILSQEPEEGQPMNPDNKVYVIISAGTKTRTMKQYVGISGDEAKDRAEKEEKLLLNVDEVESSIIPGYVAKQSIEKGTTIPDGSAITLFLSRGKDYKNIKDQKMPSLKGKTFAEAVKLAGEKGFYIGIEKKAYSVEAPEKTICKQSIKMDKKLKQGDKVLVVISKGPEMMKIPDVTGKPVDEAREILKDKKLKVITTDVYSDSVPAGNVVSQSEEAGSVVPEQTEVELTISKGKKPKKRKKKKIKKKKHKKRMKSNQSQTQESRDFQS